MAHKKLSRYFMYRTKKLELCVEIPCWFFLFEIFIECHHFTKYKYRINIYFRFIAQCFFFLIKNNNIAEKLYLHLRAKTEKMSMGDVVEKIETSEEEWSKNVSHLWKNNIWGKVSVEIWLAFSRVDGRKMMIYYI